MPISVKSIFENSAMNSFQKVSWGSSIEDKNEGVYIVSTSPDPEKNLGTSVNPNFKEEVIEKWIQELPNFKIDNVEPTLEVIKNRLNEFWLPDENILYIGKAKKRINGEALGKRISEYYITEMGDGTPHSGGQWLKTLSNLPKLFVYYGYSCNPAEAEKQMLKYFMQKVSKETLQHLRDKNLPLPFANIRYKPGKDKNHGMKNQRK